jgi:hypothetical protein
MVTLRVVLLILALISLALAAVGIPSSRVNLGWLGLFFWVLAVLVGGAA